MKRYFFYIAGNRTGIAESETITEVERSFGHGNVFYTSADAEKELAERRKPKVRHLTDEERKAMEIEQQKFGWSMFTETEKAEIKSRYKYVNGKRVLKTIDDEQREFGRMMMRTEMATA